MLHEKAKRHNGCKWSVIHALMTRAFIVLPPKNIMFHVKHYVFFMMMEENV